MRFTDEGKFWPEALALVEELVAAEILKGRDNGSFDPAGFVTRQEFGIGLWRTVNWTHLAADELVDSSVLVMTLGTDNSSGGGSGWWRAPRVIATNKHVAIEGANVLRRFLLLANGGWVLNSLNTQQQPLCVWDEQDTADLAYLLVSEALWTAYLDQRVANGLPREPRYIDPNDSREVRHGEPVIICGAPVMYDFAISEGIVSKCQVLRTEGSRIAEYVMTTAAINPGNSGGIALTFDRRLIGLSTLKPWYSAGSWGMTHGDDMGLVLHWRDVLAWEKRRWQLRTAGL